MIRDTDIKNEIVFIEKTLERVLSESEKLRNILPEGVSLRAAKHTNSYQYFMRRSGKRDNGEYIKQKDIKTAAMLAQLEYDEKLAEMLREAEDKLMRCRGSVEVFEEASSRLARGKSELIKPHYVSDSCYVRSWKAQEYEGLEFREGAAEFYTRNGLRVRSKSEVIIADMLDESEIPFLYEKPLKLKQRTVHPDFTLLDMSKRKEIYWEHFGMMDDKEYRDDAFMKIREYEESGLYQYDSVIWTFETGRYPLNTREIRAMIKTLKPILASGYAAEKTSNKKKTQRDKGAD